MDDGYAGAVFDVGGVVEPPRVSPRIRGRENLPAGGSPLAPEHLAPPREGFPLLARPAAGARSRDLRAWARAARSLLDARLADAGAILLRGLPLASTRDFSAFQCALDYPPVQYEHSTAARIQVAPRVLTTNALPPDRYLMLHNEMAFERPVPSQLFFFCEAAPGPGEGGETPIARNEDVQREIGEDLVAELERRGIRRRIHYPSRTPGTAKPERTWQAQFDTEERGVVERRCRQRGLAFQWGEAGDLTTLGDQPVTIPWRGRRLWFCSPQVTRPVTSIDITYRDGAAIEPEVLERLRAVQWRAAVAFSWQPGDLLCLHNLTCQHGRLSYPPGAERRLYLSLASPALARSEQPAPGLEPASKPEREPGASMGARVA